MPVGVDGRLIGGTIKFSDLFGGEIPAFGSQILAELLLVSGADDDGGNRRTLQKPVQGDLGDGLAGFLGDCVQGVDDVEQVLIRDWRAGLGGDVEAAGFRQRLAAADLAGEAAPAEGAPDECADFLVEAEGHQFPLILAADEGVVDLVGDVAGPAVAVGDGQGFHQMPAGEVGAGDVTDFALTHKIVQRIEHLVDRREGVEAMQMVDVHVIGVETAQAAFKLLPQVVAGGAFVVGAVAHGEGSFGGDERLVALAFEGFAEDFLGLAVGVDIGGVKEIDAGFEADVDEAAGFGYVGFAPGFEKVATATEGSGAETEH